MIDVALKTLLEQRAGVGQRITPGSERVAVNQGLPRVVFTLIDDPTRYSDSGASPLRKATYQVDVFGRSNMEARSVASQIAAPADRQTGPGLDGYSGTIANTKIHRIAAGSPRMGVGDQSTGANQTSARATLDVLIDYRELLPQPNFT